MKVGTIGIFLALFLFVGTSAAQTVKSPEQVAQSLVDAYNARNMEGILNAYAPDSVAYSLPGGEVILKGARRDPQKICAYSCAERQDESRSGQPYR
jgi:hypothetical protein